MNHEAKKLKQFMASWKWLVFWISLALAFNVGVYFFLGPKEGLDFLGGYLIELSLSVDNVFVFLMIFTSFGVVEHAQHRVLRWGIIGAIILRFLFIFFGLSLVNHFEWLLYVFGAILVYSGFKMAFKEEKHKDPHHSRIVKILRKFFPTTKGFVQEKFFIKRMGVVAITPLFAVLVLVETSDIIFAIDSVPAVMSISRNLFIVYTSNIFAILGLRQLFFVVEHMQSRFEYVRYGVAVILAFTGVKMLLGILSVHIPTLISIVFIVVVLTASIILSALISKKKQLKQG